MPLYEKLLKFYKGPQQNTKKRYDCIKELVVTEKAYVDDMAIVHEVFEIPLRKSGLVSKKEVDIIFVNWQEILEFNRNFSKDLQRRFDSGSEMIGDVICEHLPQMTAYITFCIKQLDSAALLQKLIDSSTTFKDFVRRCQNNYATKGMPLSSFLIKPMQRITRYPLLIGKILENTAEEHEDRPFLEEALRKAERFLNCVNENIRMKENQERLEWLQTYVQNDLNISFNGNTKKLGSRKLLHFGLLTKVKSGKELIGFLFNDFFFLVQPTKNVGNQFTFQRNNSISYKMYKQPILVQDLILSRESTDNVEHGTDSNRVLKLQDNKTKYIISLLVPSVNECNLWAKQIEAAKDKLSKIDNLQNNRPKTKSPMGPTCGRLLVLVQKGKRFISLGKSHTDNIYCEVKLGSQVQQTDIARDNFSNGNVPQNGCPQVPTLIWNYSMQFQLRNVNEEILTFTVYELCSFCPDEFLGRAELKIYDIYNESLKTNGPIVKKLILHQVESGEIVVKLDLHLFNNY